MVAPREWLCFLPQVPSSPSSLRVAVWRRMREAGAAALHTSVWALPRTPEHERFLQELLGDIGRQGGKGHVLVAIPLDPREQGDLVERFRSDRDHEYSELCERCNGFLAKIERETRLQKFSFPELEELDEDLKRLSGWLRKIQTRDFFGGHRAEEAECALARCREAFRGFAHEVYTFPTKGPCP